MPNNWNKEKLLPVVSYIAVFAVVAFSVHKGVQDSSLVGTRSNRETISEQELKKQIDEAKNAPTLDSFQEKFKTISRHAHFQESENLAKDRVTKAPPLEKLALLRLLALDQIKMLHFKEADQYLQDALQIAQTQKNNLQLMLVYDDFIDLYSQACRFANSDSTRNVCQYKLNEYFQKANSLAQDPSINEGASRLVRNHCRIGLIEMGRLLELDCFDPEPGGGRLD